MHPALERLTQSVDHYERGEAIWDVKLARDKLADAAPALIAALVEIEERARVSDDNSVFDVEILQIIHKHLEPLK